MSGLGLDLGLSLLGTGNTLKFYAPLKTALSAGSNAPTFTRAYEGYVPVYDTASANLLRLAKSGESRHVGARRVENWLLNSGFSATPATSSDDISNCDSGALTASFADGVTTLTTTAGINAFIRWHSGSNSAYTVSGAVVVVSCQVRGVGASVGKTLGLELEAGGDLQATNKIVLTDTFQRFTASHTKTNSNTESVYFDLNISGGGTIGDGESVEVKNLQVENLVGQTTQVPSEYVSVGVLSAPYHGANVDGVQYFETANGNTVASNVVTEATGAAIAAASLKGELVEVARTNLCLQSQTFDNAAWTKTNTTINADDVVAPDGTTTADRLTDDATDDTHLLNRAAGAFTTSADTYYAFSIYAKAGTHDFIAIRHYTSSENFFLQVFDLSDGTLGETDAGATSGTQLSASITDVGNGWYRCSQVAKTAEANLFVTYMMASAKTGNTPDASGNISYAGTSTYCYVWGAQVELGSFPTSYISTTTGSQARAVDLAKWAYVPPTNDITIACTFTPGQNADNHFIWSHYLDGSNKIYLSWAAASDTFSFSKSPGGANHVASKVIAIADSDVNTTSYRIVCRISSTVGVDMWIDGVKATTRSANTDDAVLGTALEIGSYNDANQSAMTVKEVKVFETAKTDAECAAL